MRTRRELLHSLGGLGLLGATRRLLAETKGKPWRIGVLGSRRRPDSLETDVVYGQIPRRLKELGYVEGKDVVFEWRFAAGDYERLPALAAELVKLPVDLLVTHGTPGIRAAQAATRTIPIVFSGGADLVASGFVKSLARPGGNTTGITLLLSDTTGKQLELLSHVTQKPRRLAVIFNPSNDAHPALVETFKKAAEASKGLLIPVAARNPKEVDDGFAMAVRERANAIIVIVDSFLVTQHRRIAELAVSHRLPSMSGSVEFGDAGGLMAYGPSTQEIWRRVADYVDKVLRGANPGELPVEQPTRLELVLNRKAAKTIGVEFPHELLVQADRVIE
jgi:putative ABC transport system substrate-binding protein